MTKKQYVEVTVEKKSTTVVIFNLNPAWHKMPVSKSEIMAEAARVAERKRKDYFRDDYPDYEATDISIYDGEHSDAEPLPPPENWHDQVMTRVMSDYRDPLGDVVIENRSNGGWRRVLLVAGAKAVVDGPEFRLGRFVTLDGRPALESYGGNGESLRAALVEDFRDAFPATPLSDQEILARFDKELGWL